MSSRGAVEALLYGERQGAERAFWRSVSGWAGKAGDSPEHPFPARKWPEVTYLESIDQSAITIDLPALLRRILHQAAAPTSEGLQIAR
jgi:hypothetical protein